MPLTRRDFLKLGCATAIASVTFPGLLHAAPREVPVLLYHDIAELFRDDYTTAPALFAAQMEWLYANGYRTVLLPELADADNLRGNVAILMFDDGYASFLDYAFPLLREYRFKAYINIIGKSAGTFIDIDGSRPLLSWDEYRYLDRSGLVAFGCHTYDLHYRGGVKKVSGERLEHDLTLFQETLRRETGTTTDVLAWPYGAHNDSAIRIARKLGFRYLVTSNEGYLQLSGSYDNIPRLTINSKIDLVSFQRHIGDRP
jgi:peptidoglycan/xylan/chitin deacetylase (PgdA/CDA1 family)